VQGFEIGEAEEGVEFFELEIVFAVAFGCDSYFRG